MRGRGNSLPRFCARWYTASCRRWIQWTTIEHVTLKAGIVDHSLHLGLSDGKRAKFLWLASQGGFDLLETELERAMPGRVRVYRRPIG